MQIRIILKDKRELSLCDECDNFTSYVIRLAKGKKIRLCSKCLAHYSAEVYKLDIPPLDDTPDAT